MHKTANVLDKLPSSVQGKAKKDLHAIDQAAEMTTALQGRLTHHGDIALTGNESCRCKNRA